MALVLVSIDDVRAAIGGLEVVTVGGAQYVNATDLAFAIAELTQVAMGTKVEYRTGGNELAHEAPSTAELEGIRDRLLADIAATELPADDAFDADCANCTDECDHVAHPDGLCVMCDCRNYQPRKAPQPSAGEEEPITLAPYVSSPEVEAAGIFAKPPISDRPIIQ